MIVTFKEFIHIDKTVYFNIPYIEQENPLIDFDSGIILEGLYKGKRVLLISHLPRPYDRGDYGYNEVILQEGKMSDNDIDAILNTYEAQKQQEDFITKLCNIFIVGTSVLILCMWFMLVKCFLPSIMAIFASLFGTFCCVGYLVNWHGFNRGQNVH